MTFEDLLKLTRQRLGTIILLTVAGLAVAGAVLALTPVTYTASATAYVRVTMPEGDDEQANANLYYSASQLATQKVKAFVPVFTTETVAQGVIDELDLAMTPSALASSITAVNAANALTIGVSATASTPDLARAIADEVVEQADRQIDVLEGEGSPVSVVLMSPSSLSSVGRNPSVVTYLGAGLGLGLILGYVVAIARSLLDKRIRSSADIEKSFDVPVLGVVPKSSSIARTEKNATGDFRAEESLRKLRTNLRYANIDHEMKLIVVSSPMQGDGKSSVSLSLARVMALAGQDVILVDADLRRPTLKDTFDVQTGVGLSQLLVGSVSLEQALLGTAIPGLTILPGGDIPPNPSELLGSKRMAELLEYLAQDHVVIVDAPPVLPVTDAVVLSKSADGLVMVIQAGRTTEDQLRHAMLNVTQGGGVVAGIVLNGAASSKLDRMRYGDSEYGYGYSKTDYAYVQETNSQPGARPERADSAPVDPERLSEFVEKLTTASLAPDSSAVVDPARPRPAFPKVSRAQVQSQDSAQQ